MSKEYEDEGEIVEKKEMTEKEKAVKDEWISLGILSESGKFKQISDQYPQEKIDYIFRSLVKDEAGLLRKFPGGYNIFFHLGNKDYEVRKNVLRVYLKCIEKHHRIEQVRGDCTKGCIKCLWTACTKFYMDTNDVEVKRLYLKLLQNFYIEDQDFSDFITSCLSALRRDESSGSLRGYERGRVTLMCMSCKNLNKVLDCIVFKCDMCGEMISPNSGRKRCVTCGRKDYCKKCFKNEEHEGHRFHTYEIGYTNE